MSVISVDHQIYNQENISETLNPIYFIDFILRLCWLVSLALETISGKNIFGVIVGDEVEAHFPWDTYIFYCFACSFLISVSLHILLKSLGLDLLEDLSACRR